MLFYPTRRKIVRKLVQEINYYKVLAKYSRVKPGDKVIFVDVSDITLNRYLYNFLKFFHINGYMVYLPKSRKIIKQLHQDKYASRLLKEDFIKFGTPSKHKKVLSISKTQLSNDYFSAFKNSTFPEDTYHIPMSEYSVHYRDDSWEEKYSLKEKRKRSVFMIGNIDGRYYDKISRNQNFHILSRKAVADFLYAKDYHKKILSISELVGYCKNSEDHKVILIDTSVDFEIDGKQLKKTLKEFDFYLALPGIIIPQSHNVIEAMSVGCIPILHKTYAHLFRPGLQHKLNSMVYETFEELDHIIVDIFKLPEKEILNLRRNVSDYYNHHLTPEAVVKQIENNNFSKIYLQAENYSLVHLRKNDTSNQL